MIGPVNANVANAGKRCPQDSRAAATELEVFYNLDGNHVHFNRETGQLYFVESLHSPLLALIDATFQGLRQVPPIEQLHLDRHGYFRGARRLKLNTAQAGTLLVALRLAGIGISSTAA